MLRFFPILLSVPANTQISSDVITNEAGNCAMSVSVRSAQATAVLSQLQDLFHRIQPTSALELHQCTEQLLDRARQLGADLDFVMALALEETSIFAARNGAIILKRGQKVGRILQALEEIVVVEGSKHQTDNFIWLTGPVTDSATEWVKQKVSYFSSQGFEFADLQEKWPNLVGQLPAEFREISIASITYGQAAEEMPKQADQDSDQMSASAPTPAEVAESAEVTTSPTQPKENGAALKKIISAAPIFISRIVPTLKQSLFYLKQSGTQMHASLFSSDVYVRQKNRRKIVRIALPIIVVAVVGVITFIIISSQRQQQLQAAQQEFQPLDNRLTEIKKIVDQDPVEARKQTEDVIVEIEHLIEKEKNHKTTAIELTKKLQQTRQFYDSISGKEEFSVLPTFYDLRFVESAFLANKVDMVEDTLVFLDQGQKKVLAVNADNKQYTSLPIGDFSELKDIDLEAKNLYLLGNGISEFNMSESQPAQQLKASDDQLQNAQFIRSFNQYIYVLNPEKRNIFRYAFTDKTTLSDAAGWIKGGTSLEFDKVQSLSIDGDVWVSTKDGQIKKFTSGKQVDFTVNGLPEAFSGPITLYTNQDLNNLYVLEPGQDRLVILNKQGDFLREVKSSSLKSTTTVVANENLKKAFAVSGALVFEIAL
jgi:hypothetical protein